MPSANRVIVLRHRNDPFDRATYVIHVLSEEWRKRGIDVEVVDHLDSPVGVDAVVFPHMDLTITPARVSAVLERCPRVVNRAVKDISKRRVSRHRVCSPGQYDGPVIVKTNNSGYVHPDWVRSEDESDRFVNLGDYSRKSVGQSEQF